MTNISNVNSTALLILQQTNATSRASGNDNSRSDGLAAFASGQAEVVGTTLQPTQAQSKISKSLFSVNAVNINRMKLDLIDRTGEALGLNKDDFASTDEFVHAMKHAVTMINAYPDAEQVINKIEKDLGLDKLGVSLDDVINSAREPESDDKVTEALEKSVGENPDNDKVASLTEPLLVSPDEIGRYQVAAG